MRTVLLIAIATVWAADSTFGIWNMNAARSTFTGGGQPRSLRVQIEQHGKGEVFTMDRMEGDGSARSSSSILYFDGAPRDIQDFDCSGTQSSSRLDDRTIEIRRKCTGSEGRWLVQQSMKTPKELLIDITENRRRGGPNREWHMVLERR